jgi:PAS domain S-box-containing protein
VTEGTTPISFAGSQLDDTRHVCALFNSEDGGYRLLLPFIEDGFERGAKAIHVVNLQQHDRQARFLRRCMNDLISLCALPEVVRSAPRLALTNQSQDTRAALRHMLGDDASRWPSRLRGRLAGTDLSILTMRLGVQCHIGVLIAASERSDFAEDTETLLLNVGTNQAVIALQGARLLGEQTRLARTLNHRVAQRTSELAQVNDALKAEIAERRCTEEALRASERQSRSVIDGIPGFVAILAPDGAVQAVNRQIVEFTGKELEELRPWGSNGMVHVADLALVAEVFTRSIAAGVAYDIEQRLRRFDGAYRWFQNRGIPAHDASGRITHWYVLLTDIEDRKRTEEELRRSEAFLVEAQRLSSTGSFSWHLDTDEIAFSDQLYRIFEFEKQLPVTFEEIGTRVHPEDVPLLAETIALARAADLNLDLDYDFRLLMPDRKVKYLRMVARAIQHQGGRVEYLGTIQDVTERRLSEDALETVRSELARVTRTMSLGVLTASIAHEVNQPLSGIITNANTCLRMLAANPPNLDGALETARRTIRDGNRASDVIARLRALFRKREVVTEAIDLNEATREVIALSSQDLQRRGISLQTDLDANLPAVVGDRVQLQQVILNLLLNASDALKAVDDRPRHIFVQTTCDDDGAARLTVRDSGVGVVTESLNKLFDAFYTTKADGMGIGLSVSRSIIESHHGRLWCEPNSGPGAMFAFSLPVIRGETQDRAHLP